MKLLVRNLIPIWFILTLVGSWQYIRMIQTGVSEKRLHDISINLGWIGFTFILLTNLYILRKRWSVLAGWGENRNWLDFHIFCGLMGPTIIVFHTQFKIGGLVAITFWSMMTVAISGILGRYFYFQTLSESSNIDNEISVWEKRLNRTLEKNSISLSFEEMIKFKEMALKYVGGDLSGNKDVNVLLLFKVIAFSFLGDLRYSFKFPELDPRFSPTLRQIFTYHAIATRKATYLDIFRSLLGYWHAFHVPFTVVMYITALIHIAVALVLSVK